MQISFIFKGGGGGGGGGIWGEFPGGFNKEALVLEEEFVAGLLRSRSGMPYVSHVPK